MFLLSKILCAISKIYVPPIIKMIFIITFEVCYNIFNNLFNKKRYKFKKNNTMKTVVITGGTKGIGEAIIHTLVKLNFKIVIISRDTEKMVSIQRMYGKEKIMYFAIDLSESKQIKLVINRLKKIEIDILINNAGVFYSKILMKNNIEYQFLVNYLSHYLICGSIKAKRIVNVSSSVIYSLSDIKMERYNWFMEHYAQSKLANLLHSLLMKSNGLNACAVHPGIVCTGLFNNSYYGPFVTFLHKIMSFLFTDVNDAADNVIYAALIQELCESKDSVDFYMYLSKASVPSYVNLYNVKRLLKITKRILNQIQ